MRYGKKIKMDWVTWINTAVGIIGIIVGVIGWKSLSTATKIKNVAKADNNATIQQANVIHNGLDAYAVIKLSREIPQEELKIVFEEINKLREKVDSIPRIEFRTEENEFGGTTVIIDDKRFADEERLEKKLADI